MSSPSPSKKSNGSRRQRKRAKSSPSFGTIIPEKDTSRTLKRATSCSPSFPTVPAGQRPQENPNLVFENVNPSATQNMPPQSPHPSAPTPSNENVQVGQTDENTPIVGCATAAPSTRNQQASADSSAAKNEAPNQDNKVQRVQIEPERTGWARLYDLIRNFDEERVKDLKEDIDTLLVFAGLFSAVITAFFIESYKNLQQQPEDMTNDILRQMSEQLASLSLNGNLINSTAPSFVPTPFMTARSMVLINTLWALSLVIALITASLGILVKQWLHELLSFETHDPKERLKLRFFREVGLERWKVFALAFSLPLLLQLALVFFFAGFSIFLYELNSVVGWVTTGVMIAWLAVFVFTTFAPAFSSQCPYKTPMLKFSLSKVRPVLQALEYFPIAIIMFLFHLLFIWYEPIHKRIESLLDRWITWYGHLETLEEHQVRVKRSLDFPVIMCTQDVLQGENLHETASRCLENVNIEDMSQGITLLVRERRSGDHIPAISSDSVGRARDTFCGKFGRDQSLIGNLRLSGSTTYFASRYSELTFALSESYVPGRSDPIPFTSLPTFVRFIQEGPKSAAFTILTMYSIRLRTTTKHPDRWDNFLPWLSEAGSQLYGIANLLTATRTLIHSLWNRQQPESDIQQIADCVAAIRNDAEDSDPAVTPDPIAFIYVFAIVLNRLTPLAVVRKHRERIFEVMGELAEILTDLDGSSWSYSRKKCAEWASLDLDACEIEDEPNLYPKLHTLIRTWSPYWH